MKEGGLDLSSCANRGASRGASNFGNSRPTTTPIEPSYPQRVAERQRMTINGNERRATYKQEVRGSSPRPPTARIPCTSEVSAPFAAPLKPPDSE